MSMGRGPGRAIFTLTLSSSSFISSSLLLSPCRLTTRPSSRVFLGFKRTLCSLSSTSSSLVVEPEREFVQYQEQPLRHSILLEKLRQRHLKDAVRTPRTSPAAGVHSSNSSDDIKGNKVSSVSSFEDLGLNEEVMGALKETGISVPTEIQCLGIPSVLNGTPSVLLGSHTGSGKTLAYMLPIVQMLRRDEALSGVIMKPRRPRAVVLCPTRELSEQVFRVAKSISHHARFRSTMVSGGGRLRPQEDSLNGPIDMVVGTPGRVLQHIEEGNIVYGDVKYLVLDEADTMFDRGFGPDIQKFLVPLKNRASKSEGKSFQTVLVTATLTKAVQKLIDEEFQGILHLRTSTLHKKIASAHHDFIKLGGSENKLEALLQVLEPSLAKGSKVMVFCNTLNSSRAVDHFLGENQIFTINYHGEVPAEQRVVNLNKFKKEDGDCPTLVCTDLAARGLDLDVDHVIMFDFPLNSIDYLHRTGRTARMGAKGKVTSLVAKKDQILASRIEEAIRKNESLESLTVDYVRRGIARSKIVEHKSKNAIAAKGSSPRTSKNATIKSPSTFSSNVQRKSELGNSSKKGAGRASSSSNVQRLSGFGNPSKKGAGRASSSTSSSKPTKSTRPENKHSTSGKSSSGTGTGASNNFSKGKKKQEKPKSKLSVVGFRTRSSWNGKKEGAARQ